MPALKDEHKRFIVQRLAVFTSPSEIQKELQDMGITVAATQILYYDPTSAGTDLAQKWRELHAETRRRFLNDTSDIAIAQKSFRLRELERNYRQLRASKNLIAANGVLEQAAKEMGEAYTNRRIIEAADPAAALAGMLGVPADQVHAAVAAIGAGVE